MEESEFIENLKKPSVYGSNVESVKLLQTHISYVVLTGRYAYKIKKPVNFGFLDFSNLERRKFFCEEELRLNRRLCPEIYIGVVPITESNGDLKINGDGKIIDYAVKMIEFPQEKIMRNILLKHDDVDVEIFDKISSILVDFYKKNISSEEIRRYGSVESIKYNTDENFEQIEEFIDISISREYYDFIKNITNSFLETKKGFFEKRVKNGFIKDCHGDLHTGNIVIDNDRICIFDCIEFNKRFRYGDVASDIGFLAMDLDFLGYPYRSGYLVEKYVEKSNDSNVFDVLNFYKCYRAFVRGKVNSFRLNEKNLSQNEKKEILTICKKYFDLAYYYASLCSLQLSEKTKPVLFVLTGLTGTGKTTIARKISVDYQAFKISSDRLRKELAGVDIYEKHYDKYNTGLYSPEKMRQVYDKMFEQATLLLRSGKNVVLDATFKTNDLRDEAVRIAKENNAVCLFVYCSCPEDKVREYLEERVRRKTVSDGRWEIYVKQKDSFESLRKVYDFVEVDISNKSFEYQLNVFKDMFNKVYERVKS